jgi:hypothetical protein
VIYTLADRPERRGGMRCSNCGKTLAEVVAVARPRSRGAGRQ